MMGLWNFSTFFFAKIVTIKRYFRCKTYCLVMQWESHHIDSAGQSCFHYTCYSDDVSFQAYDWTSSMCLDVSSLHCHGYTTVGETS